MMLVSGHPACSVSSETNSEVGSDQARENSSVFFVQSNLSRGSLRALSARSDSLRV